MNDPKTFQVPALMILGSFAVAVTMGLINAGPEGAAGSLIGVAIYGAVAVVIGVIGLFVAATMLDVGFGPFGTATLQMTAIVLVPEAIQLAAADIPLIAWVAALVVYWCMLAYFFELSGSDLVWTVIILFLTKLAVAVGLTMVMP